MRTRMIVKYALECVKIALIISKKGVEDRKKSVDQSSYDTISEGYLSLRERLTILVRYLWGYFNRTVM
jgi:hypothetical protein